MFLRTIRYLLGDGYLIVIGLMALGVVLAWCLGSWKEALAAAAILILVDRFCEDYRYRPWYYKRLFS